MIKSKKITWLLVFMFMTTMFAGFGVAPAQAGTISDIVTELADVYPYIDDTNLENGITDKQAIQNARANLQKFVDPKTYGNQWETDWNTVLGDLITESVITAFGNEDTAKNKIIAFIGGISDLYYATEAGVMENRLNDFKNNTEYKATFQKLFGTDVTIDDLFKLMSDTKAKFSQVVSPKDVEDLAWNSNDNLINKIPELTKKAMAEAIKGTNLAGKLTDIGWSTDKIVAQRVEMAKIIDPSNRAELALAKAMVRSQAELYWEDGTTLINKDANKNITETLKVNDNGTSYKLKILGKNATGLVEWASSDSNIVSVTTTAEGYPVVKPLQAGTTTVTAYRDYYGGTPAKDWILKFNVKVLSANADLATLTTTAGTLVPTFDPTVTSYTLTLPSNYGKLISNVNDAISYTKADAKASEPVFTSAGAFGENAKIVVTAESGATKEYIVKIQKRESIEVNAGKVAEPDMTTNPNIELPAIAPEDAIKASVVLEVPDDVNTASVTVSTTTNAEGKQQAVLPKIEASAPKGELGIVEVSIPAGTTVTGPAGWDGTIALPAVKDVKVITAPKVGNDTIQSVSAVIEIGLGNMELTFDKPVRILIPGQAGKEVGIKRASGIVKVTTELKADTQAAAEATLVGGVKEAKKTVGADVAVWTKHFTEFFAYTPKASSPGGGGGGGGGSSFGGTLVSVTNGGTVSGNGATIVVPANAYSSDVRIKIAKFADTANLSFADKSKLVSDVLEITKDKSANFTKPITITLSFDKAKVDTDKYELVICYYDETDKKWVALDNIEVDLSKEIVSGETDHFTKFAIIAIEKGTTPEVVELTDIAGHWAEANIKSLVDMKAIAGYEDKTFRPENNITRAEFATVLVKAFNLEAKTGKVFNDTNNHWAKDSIATANAYGIISGYNDTQFGPEDKITREQMALMISKAANLTVVTDAKVFADQEKISDWAINAVAAASAEQIINGYPDNTFRPQGNATRAEAATVIVKAIKK